MRINEEIDALTTMGLDPVRFLVVPRAIAAIIMTPILTVLADFVGVLGGSVVLLSLGYSLISYFNQVLEAVNYFDFLGGLTKSVDSLTDVHHQSRGPLSGVRGESHPRERLL
jgi:phospholipid/cholesterol/gamma-HCH transport system permease protein